MAELFLVRHGQASFGSDNYDRLSPLGQQQSRWLGEYWRARGYQFDAILAGGLVRHQQTAAAIAEGLGPESPALQTLHELDEFDFHALLGLYWEQFPQQKPIAGASANAFYKQLKQAMQLWCDGQLSGTLPETWEQFEQRLRSVLARLQSDFYGQKVLAVSSGGAIAMALRHILRAPAATAIELNLQIKNTAVAHCFFNPRAIRLTTFNHVPHLDLPTRSTSVTYS